MPGSAPRSRRLSALVIAAALVEPGAALASAPASLQVVGEGVRLDLADGRDLEAGRLGRPPPSPPWTPGAGPVRLDAVRDEVRALQVVLRGGAPGIRRVRLEPATDAEGRPSPVRIEVFAARPIHVVEPPPDDYVHSLGRGAYPEVLVPTSTVFVPQAPGVAVLWVDLHVPPETPPGRVRAALEVAPHGRVELELEVLPLALPARDVAGLSAVNFGSFLQRGRRSPERLRAWMQLAHAHHLSVEYLRPTPSVDPVGRIDWAGWADEVGPYLDGSAFTPALGYQGPRAGLPVRRFVLPHTDWWPSPATDDHRPSDVAAWQRALVEYEALARARGWDRGPAPFEPILFVNSLDEPKTPEKMAAIERWRAILAGAGLADRSRFRFRVDGVIGQTVAGWPLPRILEALGPVVDDWNLCGATPWIPWEAVTARLAAEPTERALFYASNTAGEPATPPLSVDAPIQGARAWAWIVARYGLGGAMSWEVDLTDGCVAEPTCSGDGLHLDATLIFRGEELGRATDEPIPSMRLKALRRGAQDVALWSLLEARDPGTAAAIARALVPVAMGDRQPSWGLGTWATDAESYELARRAILDRLLDRSAPLPVAAIRRPSAPPPRSWRLGLPLLVAALAAVGAGWLGARRG